MFKKIVKYLEDVKTETAKVIWPSREELRESSIIVIGLSLACAFYIFVINQVLTNILKLIL